MASRHRTLSAAFAAHPQRVAHDEPKPQEAPTAAWINPPENNRTVAAPDDVKLLQ